MVWTGFDLEVGRPVRDEDGGPLTGEHQVGLLVEFGVDGGEYALVTLDSVRPSDVEDLTRAIEVLTRIRDTLTGIYDTTG